MDKLELKAMLIRAHEETLAQLQREFADNQRESNLSLEDVRDADDDSHREQTEEYLQSLERQIHQREEELKKLRMLDFGHKDLVTEGAVAQVNGSYFIIGIPACQFYWEGRHFVAMSPDAPFYQALMNRKQKESFVFNDTKYTVESVI
jgi:hypothetical protein